MRAACYSDLRCVALDRPRRTSARRRPRPGRARRPAETHPLRDVRGARHVAQEEADDVFGRYLDGTPADSGRRPATARHAAVRGNIHDAVRRQRRSCGQIPDDQPIITGERILVYFFQSDELGAPA